MTPSRHVEQQQKDQSTVGATVFEHFDWKAICSAGLVVGVSGENLGLLFHPIIAVTHISHTTGMMHHALRRSWHWLSGHLSDKPFPQDETEDRRNIVFLVLLVVHCWLLSKQGREEPVVAGSCALAP
jgi:hypothetical protein